MDERVLANGRDGAGRSQRGGTVRRALALPLLGALLATGAAACSSDNSAQLDSWAKQVCDGLRDPVTQSRAALADTGQVKGGESPGDLQKRLAADLGTLSTTNQQTADAIDKAGAPKIDNGAGVQKDAVSELHQASQGYQDVQQKLTALPTDDQAKFADGLKSIGDQVQQLAKVSTGALDKLQAGDLGKAVAKQPGCKSQPATGASGSPAAGGASGSPTGGGSPAAGGSPSTGASPGAAGSPSGQPSGQPSGSPSGSPSAPASGGPSGSGSPSPSAH
ncbi:hypothetical protein [Kitasatospora azatica]|uniref:hypothetical protein n=1 Tax=Kitasatospora azatica TaxID=58347 RepID=UPI0006920772|nr:hypothetical protein [Kitasatospora azatica]